MNSEPVSINNVHIVSLTVYTHYTPLNMTLESKTISFCQLAYLFNSNSDYDLDTLTPKFISFFVNQNPNVIHNFTKIYL